MASQITEQLMAPPGHAPHIGERVNRLERFDPLLDLLGPDRPVLPPQFPLVPGHFSEARVIEGHLQRGLPLKVLTRLVNRSIPVIRAYRKARMAQRTAAACLTARRAPWAFLEPGHPLVPPARLP